MTVSTNNVHDVIAFQGLLEGAEERKRIICCIGDGAYDSGMVFEELETSGTESAIKSRRNSMLSTRSSARGRAVREFQELSYESLAEEKGCGRRWVVKTTFSTFKRLFGEHSLARIWTVRQKLVANVSLYSLLVTRWSGRRRERKHGITKSRNYPS